MAMLAELKRRNVIRMAGLYLVGAWLIVQVAGTLLPMFEAPPWIARGIVVALAIGFAPALVLSWLFELTPEGIKRESDVATSVATSDASAPPAARRMDRLIVAVLVAALGYFALDKFVLAPRRVAVEPAAASGAALEPGSIAVLPFVDMSREHDQEYFSDGIAEELLNRLAQIPKLRVAARTSAFRFKGKSLDIADVGRQLQVAHVLEGSVRKDGERLRITAQLINCASGFHMWSQTYEGDARDVFKVQDEIAAAIAEALKTRLSDRAADAPDVEPQAYDDYLQGRAFFARRVGDNLEQAVAAYDRAIARNPAYAAAHAGRAFALALSVNWLPWLPAGEAAAQSRASADRALELDPRNIEALVVRGYLAMSHWQLSDARAAFERAYAIAPDNVDVLNFYGDFMMSIGNLREAERLKRRAMSLDPLSFVHAMNLQQIYVDEGRLPDALAMAERSEALGNTDGHHRLFVLAMASQFEAAERKLESVCAASGADSSFCLTSLTRLRAAQGRETEARAALERLIEKNPPTSAAAQNRLAILYALLGDIPNATRAMRRSIDGGIQFAWNPMRQTAHGALLPEEVSRDPDWLKLWDDPRLREWNAEYRRNIVAFRNGA